MKNIQKTAKDSIAKTPTNIKKNIESNVKTTEQERQLRSKFTFMYATGHAKGYLDKKDGQGKQLVDASPMYDVLSLNIATDSTYDGFTLFGKQQVIYDMIFCLEKL